MSLLIKIWLLFVLSKTDFQEKLIKFCLLNFENNKNLFKIFCDFELFLLRIQFFLKSCLELCKHEEDQETEIFEF